MGGGCCEILAGEKWIIDKIFLKVHQEKQDIYVQFESPKKKLAPPNH